MNTPKEAPQDPVSIGVLPVAGPVSGLTLKILAVCFALIPTLAGTRRGLVVPVFRVSEALAVLVLAIVFITFNKRMVIGGAVFWSLLGYASVVSVMTAYNCIYRTDLGISDFIYNGLGPLTLLLIYVSASACSGVTGLLQRACRYLLIFSSVMGLLAVLQGLGVQSARNFASYMTGNASIANPISWKIPRSVGVFNSWHAYAGYAGLCVVIGIACLVHKVPIFKRRSLLVLSVIANGLGLLSSLTIGVIVLVCVISIYFTVRYGRKIYLLFGLAAGYLFVTGTSISTSASERAVRQESTTGQYDFLPQTVAFRLELWARDFLPLVKGHLFTGYGPIGAADRTFAYVESMYILVLLLAGIPALVAFILVMSSSLRASYGLYRFAGADSLRSSIAEALLLFLAGLSVLMFIHPYMNDAGASQLSFVILGLLGVSAKSVPAARGAGSLVRSHQDRRFAAKRN
ncbi:hypothetical protein C8K36_10943 [Rhodococcus sp. OK519]|uniref:hypothetical protein n=1 Tax=Rhodococcus sp. OK519 TaxID=2135729 RepID=UPI000D3F0CDC|nr:hypothetical protein C8K36_10943 [Rhodococcus sp. OK519]